MYYDSHDSPLKRAVSSNLLGQLLALQWSTVGTPVVNCRHSSGELLVLQWLTPLVKPWSSVGQLSCILWLILAFPQFANTQPGAKYQATSIFVQPIITFVQPHIIDNMLPVFSATILALGRGEPLWPSHLHQSASGILSTFPPCCEVLFIMWSPTFYLKIKRRTPVKSRVPLIGTFLPFFG